MQDEEVVRIHDDLGFPAPRAPVPRRAKRLLAGKAAADVRFQTMQSHVSEDGREYGPLPRSGFGGGENTVIQASRREPTPDRSAQLREGLQLAHESGLVDAVEAFRDIRIQAVLGLC